MADIFISYSRRDSKQAEQLAEMLTSAGLSCWIDKHAIELATSWSREIVQAIDSCRAFVVLLSPASIESHNVVKEVALAAEQKKKILPLDLEPVQLSEDLRYHLAGIQRAPMTNIDSIIRALARLGLEATGAPRPPKIMKQESEKKSLMILPFEDLSPTADNQWFADGIVSELISALSNIEALKISDAQETKEFRSFKGHLTTYAREMQIRYFVQGDVRKFGDQIKISARLLDIETGDHLWQDSIKGTMADVFEIQEQVANKVVEGFKLHLTSQEKKKLAERGTENAEAYELCMKANEYFDRQTKEGKELSAQLASEAIHLDPNYVRPYGYKANALVELYRVYNRNPALLGEAEQLCEEALRRKPDFWSVYHPLIQILMHRGKLEEAERTAQEWIKKAPANYSSHFALGFFYSETGQPDKSIAPYEAALSLKPDDLNSLTNLVGMCAASEQTEKCAYWAGVALPYVEKHLRLNPDHEGNRVWRALLLHWVGNDTKSLVAAREIVDAYSPRQIRDGISFYNTAALFFELGEKQESLHTLRRAIEAGFRNRRAINAFLAHDGIASLAGTPEYDEVKRMVEQIERGTISTK